MIDIPGVAQAVLEIRKKVETSLGGFKDDQALTAIKGSVGVIRRRCGGEPGILQKAGSIETWAGMLYSERKSQGYGGPDRVKGFIYEDCQSIVDRLRASEAGSLEAE